MVKSVLGVNHSGLRDWLVQRVSAILMVFCTVGLVLYIACHPGLTYPEWHYLFSQMWVKVVTLLFILSLLWHAWVGTWTILTDYVKPFVLRLVLYVAILLALVACFFYGLLVVWGV